MARFNFGGSNPFDVFGSGVSDKPTQPPVSPEVLEAINARKDANAAASAATNQYEADIADFKNTQATEMEQGIAGLREEMDTRFGNFSNFDPSGLQSQIGGLQNQQGFDPSGLQSQIGGLQEQFGNFQGFDPSGLQDRLAELESTEVPTYDDSQLREDMNTRFGDFSNFDFSQFQDRLADLEQTEVPTYDDTNFVTTDQLDNVFSNLFDQYRDEGQFGYSGETPAEVPQPVVPPSTPLNGWNIPWDTPWDIPTVPVDSPTVPVDPQPVVPPPPEYTGPRNYYTGEPIINQYQPYSTDSGAAPLKRKITPEEFGRIPEPVRPPTPLPRPFVDERDVSDKSIKRANNGGYLNKGISQLPMNGQGDTLTTQIFQSGFRPRR